MDNAAFSDPYDEIGGDNKGDSFRRNSADYQTANIGSEDDGDKMNGEVAFSETKVNMDDDRLKQRTARKVREIPLKPYAGMNKEDLLRFSNTPFWNRLRMACLVLFWLCWLGLLAAVIALTFVLPRCTAPPTVEKWQSGVYYQIYVRSFADSDGDGIGDINGIISKLDYLEENHVDAILLSSMYEGHTTDQDFGYDVTDHTALSSEYGSIDDFTHLLHEAHERDISVILDFIPGQTGANHDWFVASSQSTNTNDQYRNFYIWSDCTVSPPNNWVSIYNQPAWRDNSAARSGCYLSQFLANQPQLNLRSGAVRDELENILRFWLDLGVDGFKVVNAPYLYVDYDLRSETTVPGCSDPTSYECLDHIYTRNQDETYNVIASWRTILEEYSTPDHSRILITDADESVNETTRFYGVNGGDAANLPMNYILRHVDENCHGECIQEHIQQWLDSVPSDRTSNWAITNQDMPRNASSLGASLINLLTLTLPGGAFFYYGDELGLVNGPRPVGTPVDPAGRLNPEWSRDPFRNPMPWNNNTNNGGFINETLVNPQDPWLPIYTNLDDISVMAQENTRRSILQNFRHIAQIKHDEGALQFGHFRFAVVQEDIISYVREYDGYDNILVTMNIGDSGATIDYTEAENIANGGTLLFFSDQGSSRGDDGDVGVDLRRFTIGAGQAAIVSWPFSRPTS